VLATALARGATGLAATTALDRTSLARHGHRGQSTTLVGLLCHLQDCLEGLALVCLHGLLHVGQPLVMLTTILRLHLFVLTQRSLLEGGGFFNEPRPTLGVEIPLATICGWLERILVDHLQTDIGGDQRDKVAIEVLQFFGVAGRGCL
jgi:hypothetical protein